MTTAHVATLERHDHGVFGLLATLARTALVPRKPARASAQAAAKPGLLERFDRWMANARQRDVERYLAQSQDVFDLERRIRDLERRPHF
jgi:hypothetical protein